MDARVAAIAAGAAPELVWLLEHPPLYTAGTSAQAGRPARRALPGASRAGRGGQLTYHGPGQRVGLCDARPQAARAGRAPLRRHAGGMDHPHARRLQRARRAARGPHRRLGASGPTRATASRTRSPPSASACKRWVTLHGIAINVEPDLSHFAGIVPCGVSVAALRRHQSGRSRHSGGMTDVDMALRGAFEELFGADQDQKLRTSAAPKIPRRARALLNRRRSRRADRSHRRASRRPLPARRDHVLDRISPRP